VPWWRLRPLESETSKFQTLCVRVAILKPQPLGSCRSRYAIRERPANASGFRITAARFLSMWAIAWLASLFGSTCSRIVSR
jgi:hypothetical protein